MKQKYKIGKEDMRNIRLVIEYEGKDFNGWQKQPNKLNIQRNKKSNRNCNRRKCRFNSLEVELMRELMLQDKLLILKQRKIFQIEEIPYALNSQLKKSIRIQSTEEVDERFHSRYSCKEKLIDML